MMSTPTDLFILTISIGVYFLLYYGAMTLSKSYFQDKGWSIALGKRIMLAKEKQLIKSPILKHFVRTIEKKEDTKATVLISSLIYLKALGMAVSGFFGLSLLLVPFQGLLMSAILKQSESRGLDLRQVKAVAAAQLRAMLLLATLGTMIGYRKWIEQYTWKELRDLDLAFYGLLLVLALVPTVTAARLEVAFFKKNRALIG